MSPTAAADTQSLLVWTLSFLRPYRRKVAVLVVLLLSEIALGALLVTTVGQVVALGWFNLRTMPGRVGVEARVVEQARWGA